MKVAHVDIYEIRVYHPVLVAIQAADNKAGYHINPTINLQWKRGKALSLDRITVRDVHLDDRGYHWRLVAQSVIEHLGYQSHSGSGIHKKLSALGVHFQQYIPSLLNNYFRDNQVCCRFYTAEFS